MAIRAKKLQAKEQLTDMQWDYLCGRPLPELSFGAFAIEIDFKGNNQELWQLHRDVILAVHVKENPGIRPALWWEYDCPRLPIGTFPGFFVDGKLPQPRKRLGGTGTAAYECRAVKPSFSYGIPDIWVGINQDDPPVFESQAAFLKRHGMFLPGEEKRSDFEPETIPHGNFL
jgi:hypothetical protein